MKKKHIIIRKILEKEIGILINTKLGTKNGKSFGINIYIYFRNLTAMFFY